MAGPASRKRAGNRDKLQNLGVSSVFQEINESGENAYGIRLLNSRALLLHNAHVQDGLKRDERCGFCSNAVPGVITTIEVQRKQPPDGVVQSGGADEKDDAASAPLSRRDWGT